MNGPVKLYILKQRERWAVRSAMLSLKSLSFQRNIEESLTMELSEIEDLLLGICLLWNENFVGNVIQVYHRKRQYYMQWGEDNDRCRLIDTYDFTPLKWVRAKNCSPIMCKTDKTII